METPEAAELAARQKEIDAALAPHGLVSRGWLSLESGEADGFRSALLVGQGGASIWPHLSAWMNARPEEVEHPVDEWTRETVDAIAARFAASAAYPFQQPYLPFQRWAQRAEGLRASPLGILMHPRYGLWHAYRAALLFQAEVSIQAPEPPIHLCDLCDGKPCLSACPAVAWTTAGLAVDACRGHLRGTSSDACMNGGCLARNACPHGAYRYPAAVQSHHQRHFLGRLS